MAAPTLPPAPLDSLLAGKDGSVGPAWGRWFQQLQSIVRVSLPFACYATATAQTIPNNTTTVINFDTRVTDTDSAVTPGAGWVFTCSKAGLHLVSATVLISYAPSTGIETELAFFKNGAAAFYGPRLALTTTAAAWFEALNMSVPIDLSVGDTLDVRAWQASGASRSLAGGAVHNWVTIKALDVTG